MIWQWLPATESLGACHQPMKGAVTSLLIWHKKGRDTRVSTAHKGQACGRQ